MVKVGKFQDILGEDTPNLPPDIYFYGHKVKSQDIQNKKQKNNVLGKSLNI